MKSVNRNCPPIGCQTTNPDPSEPDIRSRRHVLKSLGAVAALPVMAKAVPSAAAVTPNGDLIGEMSYHVTDTQSTLLDLARFHDLGLLEVSSVNRGVDVWVPGQDRLILLPTAHLLPETQKRGIVVNLAELRLYQYLPGGKVHTHTIGIGRDGFSTPFGQTKITRKKANPTWYPTDETRADMPELPRVVGPGPDNPLGLHAIYLGWPTYLIHGTNKPFGVGRRVSRGCIRMYPESVEALFTRVDPGNDVEVIHQPIKLGWHKGELYIEAHPDTDQLDELEATYDFTVKPPPDIRQQVIDKAGLRTADIDWAVLRSELIERRGIPVAITGRTKNGGNRQLTSNLPKELSGIY